MSRCASSNGQQTDRQTDRAPVCQSVHLCCSVYVAVVSHSAICAGNQQDHRAFTWQVGAVERLQVRYVLIFIQ